MILKKKGEHYLFQFGHFNRFDGLFHAIGCRGGGGSQPPFDGFNLSYGVGDEPDRVAANRRRWLEMTGGGVHCYAYQNHGTGIEVIKRGKRCGGVETQTAPVAADALITDCPGVRLLIQTADCQAVMLFEPVKRVVANIHCGWRGSSGNIIGLTVRRMAVAFECDPERMIAAIGPSLGPCCAEFVNYETEIPRALWPFRVGPHHFDFWRISRHQLLAAGLLDGHVHSAGICTRCNPHLFFSYRASRTTGRFAALIGMDDDIPSR
jgi:polyphenol oxidase